MASYMRVVAQLIVRELDIAPRESICSEHLRRLDTKSEATHCDNAIASSQSDKGQAPSQVSGVTDSCDANIALSSI